MSKPTKRNLMVTGGWLFLLVTVVALLLFGVRYFQVSDSFFTVSSIVFCIITLLLLTRKGVEQRKHLITCLAYNMASVTLMYTQIAHYGTSLLIFVGQILANLLHTSIILLIAIVRFFTKKK